MKFVRNLPCTYTRIKTDDENIDQIQDEDTEVKAERDKVADYFTNRFKFNYKFKGKN